jgi:hypothetical protein
MGLFQKEKNVPKRNVKCAKCRKVIRKGQKYCIIDRKTYCEKCAKNEKEWRFLEFMDLMED